MNPIDAYLAELRAALGDRLAPAEKQARLREVRSHLTEAASAEGGAIALTRFGPPIVFARAIIRQARGYDARSAASLALLPGLLLATTLLTCNVWIGRHPFTNHLELSAWVTFAAVLFFAARCFATRRWLTIPSSLWAAVGIGGIFAAQTFFPTKLDPVWAKDRIASVERDLAIWDRKAQQVEAWRSGNPPLDEAPYAYTPTSWAFIPGLPTAIRISPVWTYGLAQYGYDPHEDHIEAAAAARIAWKSYGEGWAVTVSQTRHELNEQLAAMAKGLERPPKPLAEQLRLWGIATVQITIVLAVMNALALSLGKLADLPWRRRRLRA